MVINRAFGIQSGELRLVLIMGILLLGNDMARQTSSIVGISDFLSEGGVNQFLLVRVIDAILIITTSALSSLIVDRFDRIKLLRGTVLIFTGMFVLLWLTSTWIPAWLSAALLFILSQQQWLIYPLFFWVLANDIFSMAQAKRLFPLISSWSFLGKTIGISTAFLPVLLLQAGISSQRALTLEMVALFNIGVYLLAFILITVGLGSIKLPQMTQKPQTLTETLKEGGEFLREVPSFRYLSVAIVALMVVDLITEFRLLVVSKASIPDAAAYQRFYSSYLLGAAVISFLVQSFLTGRIINKLQLKSAFMIVPVVGLASVLVMIIAPGLITVVAVVLILKVFRNTIDNSTRKSFQSLVPSERRGRVSLFQDNYLPGIGTILGCILAGMIIFGGILLRQSEYFYGYLGIAAIAAIVDIWAIFKMQKVYDSSLLNWNLKRRRRRGLTGIIKTLDH